MLAFSVQACTEAKAPLTDKELEKLQLPTGMTPEGSPIRTETAPISEMAKRLPEGSQSKSKNHPAVTDANKIEREIFIPKEIEGKWKAVKLLIHNKINEEETEVKTVELGSEFQLDEGGFKVSVGPFFPNFVMNETSYSSMTNQLINPAVQLVIEEKGKIIYKGWAFQRFPTMYSFDHEVISLELLEGIPADMS